MTKATGPFEICQERLERFPILNPCYHSTIQSDLQRALERGYFVDNLASRVRRGIPGHRRYYDWTCSVLIPYIAIVPRRTTAHFQVDLLPSCQVFKEDSLDEFQELLKSYRVRSSFWHWNQRVAFIDNISADAVEELGIRMVEFVKEHAIDNEPERSRMERRVDAALQAR